MKRMGHIRASMVLAACVGMILPMPALQAEVTFQPPSQTTPPQTPPAQVPAGQETSNAAVSSADVELDSHGVLSGRVVDAEGIPMASVPVSLRFQGREVARTLTDAAGNFRVAGLRGGVYEIVAGTSRGLYRIWAPGTAPPTANSGKMVVIRGQTVRGQDSPVAYWLRNPWVIAGMAAVAVAVPVAIHNSRIRRSSSP